MSWLGLRHKGIEPLFPEEWNAVVDGLDWLYDAFNKLLARIRYLEELHGIYVE